MNKKEYETNIKPADIPYTEIQRNAISDSIKEGMVNIYSDNEDGQIVKNIDNDRILEISTNISNKRYRLENPYITDLCCNIYTLLTTLNEKDRLNVFKDLSIVKGNARFWISKKLMIKLALGNIVNSDNHTLEGAERVRKTVIDTLMPILNRKKLVPTQTVKVQNLKLSNGKTASFTLESSPLRILSKLTNDKNGDVGYEVELNGVFYPIRITDENKYIANTRYIHTIPNLACVLDIGEDIYMNSKEYKEQKKPFSIKAEVARRFIDILQLSYNQKHNLPCTNGKKSDNKFILEVWDETLKSLYPKAFKPNNKIYKTEFIQVANLASLYFKLGIEFIGTSDIVKQNEYLLIPSKTEFCKFDKNSNTAIFTAYIN